MYELSRGIAALVGAALGGFLVWLATQVNSHTTGGYWAEYGLVAGAGLVLALGLAFGSATRGLRPAFSPGRFLFSFLPVLVVVGWVVISHQPHGNWFRAHVRSWSGDIGVRGVVNDLDVVLDALAIAAGVIFGFCFDTVPVPVDAAVAADADEPLAAERRRAAVARERTEPPAETVDDGAATTEIRG